MKDGFQATSDQCYWRFVDALAERRSNRIAPAATSKRNRARHRSLRSFQMPSANGPATRLATRLSFLVAGFGIACWAPLVPFAKVRLDLDDGTLGILLLCIGIGSVAAMMAAGSLSARYGSRPVILVGGFGLAVMLPILPVAPT